MSLQRQQQQPLTWAAFVTFATTRRAQQKSASQSGCGRGRGRGLGGWQASEVVRRRFVVGSRSGSRLGWIIVITI